MFACDGRAFALDLLYARKAGHAMYFVGNTNRQIGW